MGPMAHGGAWRPMAMQTSDYLIHLHDPLSHFRGLPVLLGVSASVCARAPVQHQGGDLIPFWPIWAWVSLLLPAIHLNWVVGASALQSSGHELRCAVRCRRFLPALPVERRNVMDLAQGDGLSKRFLPCRNSTRLKLFSQHACVRGRSPSVTPRPAWARGLRLPAHRHLPPVHKQLHHRSPRRGGWLGGLQGIHGWAAVDRCEVVLGPGH